MSSVDHDAVGRMRRPNVPEGLNRSIKGTTMALAPKPTHHVIYDADAVEAEKMRKSCNVTTNIPDSYGSKTTAKKSLTYKESRAQQKKAPMSEAERQAALAKMRESILSDSRLSSVATQNALRSIQNNNH